MNKSGDLNGSTPYLSDVCIFPVSLSEEMERIPSVMWCLMSLYIYKMKSEGRKYKIPALVLFWHSQQSWREAAGTRTISNALLPLTGNEVQFKIAQCKNIKLTHIHTAGHWNKHKHFIFLNDKWPQLSEECRVWRRWHGWQVSPARDNYRD